MERAFIRYFHLLIRRLAGLISERLLVGGRVVHDDDLKEPARIISCTWQKKKKKKKRERTRGIRSTGTVPKWQSTRLIPHEPDLRDKTIGQFLLADTSSIHAPPLDAL